MISLRVNEVFNYLHADEEVGAQDLQERTCIVGSFAMFTWLQWRLPYSRNKETGRFD